ncbi:shikimate kinase [Candidatus Haliotispira prima]|uniref:Shikimate kinase n=1 Tax=Candidatus Haliotispira prima TaxID=3034016 RepID=A0ABY8ME50_9SPIO|nr:shikimate kinase [Candidatus Haliotispira prima]
MIRDDRSIVIIGLKHCGKSSVARILAKHLRRPHYDTDNLLEELYFAEQGKRLNFREIYAKLGKQRFDQLQMSVLKNFFDRQHSGGFWPRLPLLSLGGGAGDLPEVGHLLDGENCLVVLLEENPELLFERISATGLPSFLSDAEGPEEAFLKFCRLSEQRLVRYRDWAEFRILCRDRGQEEVALELLQRIER